VTDLSTVTNTQRRIAVLLLLAAALLWSINGLFIKVLHERGVSGWAIAGYRSMFACLFLTPFVVGKVRSIRDRVWVVAAVLAFTGMCATFVIATTQTSAANAILLQYTAPVWVFVFAPLITGERASRHQYVALGASISGVVIIFFRQFEPGQSGLVIGIVSGVVFGLQTVLFRKVRQMQPLTLVWLVCGGSGVVLLAIAAATGQVVIGGAVAGWLGVMGVVQFGLPYVLYCVALNRLTAQQVVLIVLIEAVLNPVWVWIFRGEVPHASTLVGGAFIIASVVYLSIVRVAGGRGDRSGSG